MKAPAATTTTAAVPALREGHVRRITAAAEASHSPATLRNYRAAWAPLRRYGPSSRDWDPLPAPETVAAYLAERAAARSAKLRYGA